MKTQEKQNIEILEERNSLKLYGEVFAYTVRILSLYKNKKPELNQEIEELLFFYEEYIETVE